MSERSCGGVDFLKPINEYIVSENTESRFEKQPASNEQPLVGTDRLRLEAHPPHLAEVLVVVLKHRADLP